MSRRKVVAPGVMLAVSMLAALSMLTVTTSAPAWDVEPASQGNTLELEIYNLERDAAIDGLRITVADAPGWMSGVVADLPARTVLGAGEKTSAEVRFDVTPAVTAGERGEIVLRITGADGFECRESIAVTVVEGAEEIQTDCCANIEILATDVPVAIPSAALVVESFPNPSSDPVTTIRFALAAPSEVEISVHDVAGRLVRVLEMGPREAGAQEVRWDGRATGGEPARSGLYFVRVRAGGRVETAKLVLTR